MLCLTLGSLYSFLAPWAQRGRLLPRKGFARYLSCPLTRHICSHIQANGVCLESMAAQNGEGAGISLSLPTVGRMKKGAEKPVGRLGVIVKAHHSGYSLFPLLRSVQCAQCCLGRPRTCVRARVSVCMCTCVPLLRSCGAFESPQ